MSVIVNLETHDIVVEVDYQEKGDTGKSAYDDAVDLGFVGTREEWIASLKQPALDAAEIANNAADNANEKALLADQSAQNAIEATRLANDATDSAISATNDTVSATNNANVATNNAITATNEANSAKDATIQAISDAQNATQLANQSATNANNKAGLADTAAINANAKATLAQTATDNANIATQAANTATTNANDAAEVARTSWQYVNYLFGYSDELGAILEYAYLNNFKAHSTPYLQKLDKHIKDLKAAGLFGKIDLAYWMVGDGDLNFKTINIIDPSKYKGTPNGGLVNTLQGIDGNGVDAYIDTNFNHAINSVKQTINDAGRVVYLYKSVRPEDSISGDKVGLHNIWRALDSYLAQRVNSLGNITPALNFLGNGFKAINRISSNSLNGVNISTVQNGTNATAPSLQNATHVLLLTQQTMFSLNGISTYALGSSITGQDAINYRQAILNNL